MSENYGNRSRAGNRGQNFFGRWEMMNQSGVEGLQKILGLKKTENYEVDIFEVSENSGGGIEGRIHPSRTSHPEHP
jgi:hypothetical protein